MTKARFLISSAVVALAACVAQPIWAQPRGGPGRSHPAEKEGKRTQGKGAKKGPPGLGHAGPPSSHGAARGGRDRELKQKQATGTLTEEEKKQLEQSKQRLKERQATQAERRQQRQAHLDSLKQKQAEGTLSEQEKKQLERIQKIDEHHQKLNAKLARRWKDRAARRLEARRRALQQRPNLAQDQAALAEYRKHAERMARLERARDLAQAEGRGDLAGRIRQLIEHEQKRHQAWLAKPSGGQP
ncbi:hypothetical protein ACFL5O_00755 [Myxococcota bacterium]